MAWFKKKDKYDDIDMTLLDDDDFYIGAKKASENAPKPHSLTADEIVGDNSSDFYVADENPLESLRKKMISRSKPAKEVKAEEIPLQEETEEPIKSFFSVNSDFLEGVDSNTIKAEEKADDSFTDIIMKSEEDSKETPEEAQENAKEETIEAQGSEPVSEEKEEEEESLLQNCLPFIMDGNNGEYVPDNKPVYTLDSVASILGIEEPEKEETEEVKEIKEEPEKEIEKDAETTIVFKKIDDTGSLPDISDIDNRAKNSYKDTAPTTTMPVIIPDEMISSTRDVDVPKEISEVKSPVDLSMSEEEENAEYQEFTPEYEYHGRADRKKVKMKLLTERRSRFLKVFGSVTGLIILGILAIPAFSDKMLSFNLGIAIFTSLGYLLPVLCNWDVFLSIPSLFTRRTSAEAGIALSVTVSFITMLLSLINGLAGEIYFGVALMTALSLVFRSYFRFRKSHYVYNNFLKVSTDKDKYGVALIDDAPTTFAMANKAIDGDVLIAAPKRTHFVTDFIKNSTFDVDLDGRAKLIFYIGLAFSLLAGVAFGLYRDNFMTGAVTVCAFTALFAPLTSLACSVLPLSSAAAHLNRYGAVITGLKAAKQIEAANACVIDCDTLFPKGSIKLANMKVLAPNNLEETIACACAITTNIKSPLAPVFKEVMETNKAVEIPIADSIKYEKRLGVTGWVGNKRIFIGNRALMLAHEIPVPDAERDKKLMRDGYFPVYVACNGKACALLVLKYVPDPDIAKELDRISAMGLTILINNCDQNISEEMVCDYFDLYSDSVKMMSGSGVHMYKTAVNFEESMNAGAITKRGAAGVAATVYCANRVKKSNTLLQIAHIISIVLGVILFSYVIFSNAFVNCTFVALYQFACFILSATAYLFTKP